MVERLSLYKYVPFQDPSLPGADPLQIERKTCFENGEIWYPQAKDLNDPYECTPSFEFSGYGDKELDAVVKSLTDPELNIIAAKTGLVTKKDIIRILNTPDPIGLGSLLPKGKINYDFIHRAAFLGALRAIHSLRLSSIGVLSLTEDPLNLRMWAQYGGNSRGICIEFQRTSLNVLGSPSTRRVRYVRKRPKILLPKRHASIARIVTTKSQIWRDEKEWRDIKPLGGRPYPYPGKVQKVIFGLNTDKKTVELTKGIFGPDVEYHRVALAQDYSLKTDGGLEHAMDVALSENKLIRADSANN